MKTLAGVFVLFYFLFAFIYERFLLILWGTEYNTSTFAMVQLLCFRTLSIVLSLSKNTNRTMDNVQKHNSCTNVPSSQTFRSYLPWLINHLG
jgi:hypothetical protein